LKNNEIGRNQRVSISNRDKIILLLSEFYKYMDDEILPQKISQSGISTSLGLNRPNVTKELIKLKKMGIVVEKMVRLEGVKRRKKGYFITNKGLEEAKKIKELIGNLRITCIDSEGNQSEIRIEDTKKILGNGLLSWVVRRRLNISRNYIRKSSKARENAF
jgi:DNA-binding PadR family transcriptional regulator